MDRRSWLWRRKSSDKSPGETESSASGSGSISSPSERFSDEHQGYLNQNTPSPDITSKATSHEEDDNGSVRILSEKLSAALANITAKEALANQHAKVAEEAVTGWEKAEKEVVTLKQQLEVATKKNSSLEERVVHLDGALKECLRQLRQVREEQDQKIQEAISKKSQDTVSKKSELQSQISDLQAQLEAANAKAEAAASLESDLRLRLESNKKEYVSLQFVLQSRLEELEIRTLERDLSTKTAETASKQHLEGIKKVAKLEAECRRLRSIASKATSLNEQKSFSASPSHVDSPSDSHSDTWASALIAELDHFKDEKAPSKKPKTISTGMGLMDDFLEMERLAAIPVRENKSNSLGSLISTDKLNRISDTSLRAEFEAMINKTIELEEKAKIHKAEKEELSSTLVRCQDQIKLSEARSVELQANFNECQNQLKISQAQLTDANKKLVMLQAELDLANELRQAIEMELEDANVRREEAESNRKAVEDESNILLSKVGSLESEAEKERSLYSEASAKCRTLEDELSRLKHEFDSQQNQLVLTSTKKEAVESQLEVAQGEVKSLQAKISSLENEAGKKRSLYSETSAKHRALEDELSRMKHEIDSQRSQLASTNAKKEAVESQLEVAQGEVKSLQAKIHSLENEVGKDRSCYLETSAKHQALEGELSRMKHEIDTQQSQLASTNANKAAVESQLEVAQCEAKSLQTKISSLENELSRLKHEAEICQSQLASVSGSKEAIELEFEMTNARRQEADSQLEIAHGEAKSLLAKVGSLEHEVEKERALSAEFAAKCRKLENELLKMKSESGLPMLPLSKEELDIQQEKEIAVAASKLAECQKTIASLGMQLKSLATFDDLFLDSDKLTEISEESQLPQTDTETSCLSSSSKPMIESDSLASKIVKDGKQSLSLSTSSNVDKSQKNGFGKLFFQSKGSMRGQRS